MNSKDRNSLSNVRHGDIMDGLQKLGAAGLDALFWRRLRLDQKFASDVMESMNTLYQQNPGQSFEFDYMLEMDRMDLMRSVVDHGINGLTQSVVRSLSGHHAMLLPPALGRLTYYAVCPGFSLREHEVREELLLRGLVPANTEDGLLVMLKTELEGFTGDMLVLNSSRGLPGNKEFLRLRRESDTKQEVDLFRDPPGAFAGNTVYLAKRITSEIEAALSASE